MKRKKLWLILLIAVLVLAVPYWIFTGFRGSLVMRTVTTFKAKDYVAAHYPGQPYAVGFGRYDFKFMEYYCIVRSRDSEDTHFTVWCGADGMEDGYADWVEGRQNTAQRLSLALDSYADQLLEKLYPYRTALTLCNVSPTVSDAEIKKLPLDLPFDAKTFPLPAELTVWSECEGETPTWEEAATRLRELEALARDELPSVEVFSLRLQDKYEADENGELWPIDNSLEVCAYDVPGEIIRSDTLEDYLAELRAAQQAELDAIAAGENPKD